MIVNLGDVHRGRGVQRLMISRRTFYPALFGLILSTGVGCAQGSRPQHASRADSTAVQQFVQEFLDWYVPIDLRSPKDSSALWLALDKNPPALDSNLRSALRSDSVAVADPGLQRDYLNFEPFSGSQDPCRRLLVTGVQAAGPAFKVSVVSLCGKSSTPVPGVSPTIYIVVRAEGYWEIANIEYGGYDLKALLCKYAREDPRPERRPTRCW